MGTRARLVAAGVMLVAIALTASAAWGQPGCCQCQDCEGPDVCVTLSDEDADEQTCQRFCDFYDCNGKALPAGVCQLGPQCDEIVSVSPTPSLSAKGLAIAALLTFGLGTIAVRRRERRPSVFAKSA